MYVEVHDLKHLDPRFLKRELFPYSFREVGWMVSNIQQILRGYDETRPDYKLSYNKAHILVARDDDGDVLGWACVRHPSRRVRVQICRGDFAYAGRRSDFVVYVKNKYRRQGVARNLLLSAYNNWGRLTVFPHDSKSISFYNANRRFVTARNTNHFGSADFAAFEVA